MKNQEAMKSALKNMAAKHLKVEMTLHGESSPGEEENNKDREGLGLAPEVHEKDKPQPQDAQRESGDQMGGPMMMAEGLPKNGPMEKGDASMDVLKAIHGSMEPSTRNPGSLAGRAKEKIAAIMAEKSKGKY